MTKSVVCVACNKTVTNRNAKFFKRLNAKVCSACKKNYNECVVNLSTVDDTEKVSSIVKVISSLVGNTPSVNLTEVGNALKEGSNSFLDGNIMFEDNFREDVRRYEHELVDRAITNFNMFKERYQDQDGYEFISS